MRKNMAEPVRPPMTVWRIRIACWIPKATNTLNNMYTYCFFTATIVARTLLNVTWYVHCLSCSLLWPSPQQYSLHHRHRMLTHRTKNSRWQGQTTHVSATTYKQFVELDNPDFGILLDARNKSIKYVHVISKIMFPCHCSELCITFQSH